MEAEMVLEMTIDAERKKRFLVGCIIADDDSSMRAKLRHSYEALQNTVPGYVWPRAPPNKEGKLGPKLRNTGKLPLHLPMPKFLADLTHRTKVVAKKFFRC